MGSRTLEFQAYILEDVTWVGFKAHTSWNSSTACSSLHLYTVFLSANLCNAFSMNQTQKIILQSFCFKKGLGFLKMRATQMKNKSWAYSEKSGPFKESQVPEASHPTGTRSKHTSQSDVRHLRSPSNHSTQYIQGWLQVNRILHFFFSNPR